MNSSEPALTGEERAHVIRLLLESQNEFLNLISSLPDEQWTWKAAPGPWSVQQTAEYLVLGERAMLGMVEQTLAGAPDPDWQEQDARKTKFLGRMLPDRRHMTTAPAPLEQVDRPIEAHLRHNQQITESIKELVP
jgi:hypothetical protein